MNVKNFNEEDISSLLVKKTRIENGTVSLDVGVDSFVSLKIAERKATVTGVKVKGADFPLSEIATPTAQLYERAGERFLRVGFLVFGELADITTASFVGTNDSESAVIELRPTSPHSSNEVICYNVIQFTGELVPVHAKTTVSFVPVKETH